jgi:trimeric autotransporter adhesin
MASLLLLTASSMCGATFTVINTNASGDGSLYQAILDANASPGPDLIAFNILSGGLSIRPTNALPINTDPVTLDGSTQPGYAGVPLIELQGTGAGAGADGLRLASSNSVIRALVINRFAGDGIEITNGVNNTIEGCYVGLSLSGVTDYGNTLNGILITNSANNTIGGTAAASRNYIAGNSQSGIHVGGASATNNIIRGNVIGLNTANTTMANSVDGVRVNAPYSIIGGSVSGSANTISGNTGQGIEITALSTGTLVQGNYIGTDTTGTLDRGNSVDGILAYAGGVRIGGANAGEGNLICGNAGDGIEFNGASATNNFAFGNTIGGTTALQNGGNGVLITASAHDNVVGGLMSGQPNLIAFNAGAGISVPAAVANTNNAFRANSIHSNGGLGIDLGAAGVTANDANDVDTGANRLQNFPVVTTATNTGTSVVIVGSLNSTPSTAFGVDLFATLLFDSTKYGEGEFYLGSTTVTTDAGGNAGFTVTLPGGLPGRYVCATATDPSGNTSEFGPVVAARGAGAPITFTVVNTNDSGAGSLRQAILDANAAITDGRDQIHFAIPGTGPYVISPASGLPPVADPVVIDGYTQSGASVNTLATSDNAVLEIRIDGNSTANVPGLTLWGGNSAVRGLAITRFKSTSGHGLEVFGDNNLVEGNFIGVSTDGLTSQGNAGNGISVNGVNNLIGGSTPAARNLISANSGDGIEISALSSGTLVRGNYIGTDATGTLDRGNGGNGLLVYAGGVAIGGANPGEGNVIGGNAGDGIEFNGASATNNAVFGNTIGGTTALPNSGNGVLITTSAHGNVVGGLASGQPNLIAFNTGAGISVAAATANTENAFRANAIHSNTGLGIDLGAAGVTANDANDADTGANRLQNFPVVTAATNTGVSATIVGSLNSTPSTVFALDFFANLLFDSTTYGEGEFYLGSTSVTTDAGGNASFTVSFPGGLPGRYVCATATDPSGNTSEFGPVLAAQGAGAPATFTVINTNDSGPGSLRQAILDANAAITEGIDQIHFAIPGTGPHIISPPSALPPVADPVVMDGYTQSGASSNTLVTGNNAVLKIRLDGNSAANNVPGLTLWGGNSTVRGLAITRFKSGSGDGIEVFSDDNLVEGNFIGVNTDGVTRQANGGNGISISGANNLIGGATPGARNLISGNTGDGIELNGSSATNNRVLGNIIGGTTAVPNSGNGVLITGNAHDNAIGGLLPGYANLIAFNGAVGISVAAAVANTNNVFRGNSIYSNSALGIDLGAAGATLNDSNDADTGANQLQNFPVLVRATTNSPGQVSIAGSLSSAANTSYSLDFYASASLDSSGFGEGQFYLGSTDLMTDAGGQANFEVSLPVSLPGRSVSATATDPHGNTSEFSRWTIAMSSLPPTNVYVQTADFVFIVDASSSMGDNIAAVKAGLGSFVTGLNTGLIDARFAVVLFGGAPELTLDFTTDQLATEAAFDLISTGGAVAGVQNNHNLNPEAGLEAIRIVLNSAGTNSLLRNNIGGTGPLASRPDARKNLILVTDENSDQPYYAENRQPGQTTMDPPSPLTAAWQAEVDATALSVIAHNAFLNVLIDPSGVAAFQYGNPAQSASDANFLNFNPSVTLSNLITAGYGGSLEAQVLAAGLIGRTFNVTSVNTTNFIQNFFAAKVNEIIDNPLPPPRLNIASLPSAVRLTWTTNSIGFLLETNSALRLTNGWDVLTTNYSIIGTNCAVTNSTGAAVRFYRLHRR